MEVISLLVILDFGPLLRSEVQGIVLEPYYSPAIECLWYDNPDVNVPYSLFLWTMVPLGEEASYSNF